MNQSDNHTSRRQNHRINRGLALAVFGIVATGVAADAAAQFIIDDSGGSTCFICVSAPASATCNERNADFVGICQDGERALCSGHSAETFAVDCKASLQIIG